MNLPEIILASVSPRRIALLKERGLECQVVPSRAKEVAREHLSPRELAQLNAYRKARAVAKQHPDHLVIGADTVVCLGARVYGKPADRDEALRILTDLQGHTHKVVTGVCLVHLRGHRQRLFAESTDVTLRALEEVRILDYLNKIDPLDKAGAYAIQEFGEMVVETVEGSLSNVIGLPVERVMDELGSWGSA